jgi:hypothetical protein
LLEGEKKLKNENTNTNKMKEQNPRSKVCNTNNPKLNFQKNPKKKFAANEFFFSKWTS